MSLDEEDFKILSPLTIFLKSSPPPPQPKQNETANQINKLSSILSGFSDMIDKKISLFSEMIEKNKNTKQDEVISEECEERFKELRFPIQDIRNLPENQRQHKIKIFSSDLARKILAIIFKPYEQGKINEQKLRQFFCNNFLFNIIQYCSKNQVKKNELQMMDKHLKEKVFIFLQERYPQNQSSQGKGKFDKLVNLVDNIESNSNDLIFSSGIKFIYKQNGDYSKQIMQFVNYLIKISSNQYQLYDQFKKQMEDLFNNVYDMQWMAKVKKKIFDLPPSNDQQQNRNQSNQQRIIRSALFLAKQKIITEREIKQNADKQKYIKIVKQYTKYIIGKKISDNALPFENKDIDEENLKVNNPTIMRILTKWCQQLQKNFDEININSRSERFRMQDGSQRNLKKEHREKFYIQLRKNYQNIENFIQKSKKNIRQNQLYMFKNPHTINSFRQFSSQEEGKVGYFASALKKSNENYLISYLNRLIHNILSAQRDLKSTLPRKQQYKVAINLISFKLGDLFRCKISSKQTQIIALYSYLQEYCQKFKDKLQIIRVKNRLSESTKDILINLKFRKKIVVQMQLSINQDVSQFMKCSSAVKHFLYQIQRATFGPISEICNVYSSVDPRAEFFRKSFQKIQNKIERQKQNINYYDTCSHKNYQQSTFPCWCSKCKCFSYSLNIQERHRICKCGWIICSKCIIRQSCNKQILRNFDFKKISQQLQSRKQNQRIKRMKVIYLQTKKKEVKNLYLFYFNFKILFFQENQNILTIIGQAKTKEQFKNFFSGKQINQFQDASKEEMTRIFPQINGQILSKYMETIQKRRKKHFIIQQLSVQADVFKKIILKDVQTVIIRRLPIRSTKNLTIAFPEAKVILINKNAIQSLDNIEVWKKVQQLNLQGNRLQKICGQICKLEQLRFLVLSKNNIKKFPIQVCKIPNLKILNIKNNKIKQIGNQICQMKNLQILRLTHNQINKLSLQISNLQNLKQLDLSYNNLTQIGQNMQLSNDCFQGIKNIIKIDFTANKYQSIPTTLKDFTQNYIKSVSSFVFQLEALQELILTQNQIIKLEIDQNKEIISPFTKLYLDNNYLTQIHHKVYNVKSIQKLKIGNPDLVYNPLKICNLSNIKQIDLINMDLKQFPQFIFCLKNIQKLSLHGNKINTLPVQIIKLNNTLKQLDISSNQFRQFPMQIQYLTNLEILKVKYNDYSEIPTDIINMKKLQKIYIICDEDSIKTSEEESKHFFELSLNNLKRKDKTIKFSQDLSPKINFIYEQDPNQLKNKAKSQIEEKPALQNIN